MLSAIVVIGALMVIPFSSTCSSYSYTFKRKFLFYLNMH